MKNFSEEELELLKEVYRPDMGGIGTYCASFQRCMEILQDLNTAIDNLYMIESHYFGPSQAWSMWFLVQGKLTIKDIANYLDRAQKYYFMKCAPFDAEQREVNIYMLTAIQSLRNLQDIDFEIDFGWVGINAQLKQWLNNEIYDNHHPQSILNSIDNNSCSSNDPKMMQTRNNSV